MDAPPQRARLHAPLHHLCKNARRLVYFLFTRLREHSWEAQGTVAYDAEGKRGRLIGVTHDITELRDDAAALSRSEEKYRSLFNAIDEGVCVIEVLFDAHNKPVDYKFVDINPMFENQTGLVDAKGKTARELLPDLEQRWFDIYGSVALTGKTV